MLKTSGKKSLWVVTFLVIVLLVSTVVSLNKKNSSITNQGKGNNEAETINLVFSPVEVMALESGKPSQTWEKIKTIELERIKAKLHIYIDKNKNYSETKHGDVYGYIEFEGLLYEVGLLSAYGLEDLSIDIVNNMTNNPYGEIKIIGGQGASYKEMKLIALDDESKWVNLLTMGTPYIVDLDGNGVEELIAESSGTIPSYVDIYRWNGEQFVGASVTASTGNFYAYILNTGFTPENNYKKDGDWIIETGNPNEEPKQYKYEKGSLIRINLK